MDHLIEVEDNSYTEEMKKQEIDEEVKAARGFWFPESED